MADGTALPLPIDRFLADANDADATVLIRCIGPVLDVGCGPRRIVHAPAAQGIPALGVDTADVAVALTNRRGAPALTRYCVLPLALVAMTGKVEWLPVVFASGIAAFGSSHFGDPTAYRTACYAVALGLLLLGITARRRLARRRVRPAAGGEVAERDRTTRPRLDVRLRLPLIG